MLAWQITKFNAPAVQMQVQQPVAAPGQALIAVCSVGLNHADLLMQANRYQDRHEPPFTLGMELSGTVIALGENTIRPAIGTRVAAYVGFGALAQIVAVPVNQLIELPDHISHDIGAAFQIVYGTSHLALTHKANLRPHETLLVLGAAGGVGLTAVEIGKMLGAHVIAVARGPDRLAVAKAAGADVLIDSETADLKAALLAAGGVDVVYDAVGGPAFMAALSATRPEGRLLTIGFAGGDVPQIPANLLLVKNLSVLGLNWGAYPRFAPEVQTRSIAAVLGLVSDGKLHPHIGARLEFNDVPRAMALLQDRAVTGKVVITLP